MPALSAASTGALNACRSVSATAIPSAPPVTALLSAVTIWATLELSEPVHWKSQPSSLEASAAPYCVGVKKGFVVTWLMNTNLYFLCEPNTLAATLMQPQSARAQSSRLGRIPSSDDGWAAERDPKLLRVPEGGATCRAGRAARAPRRDRHDREARQRRRARAHPLHPRR